MSNLNYKRLELEEMKVFQLDCVLECTNRLIDFIEFLFSSQM